MKYSIIIPAYNEEARLGATIEDYAAYVQSSMPPQSTEILIIVNGSRDRTGEVARLMQKEYPFIRSWEAAGRLGKGGAVLQGFAMAKGSIVAFADADNATSAEELRKLIDVAEAGADAAIGSRWLPESKQTIRQPLARRIASRVFNLIVRLLFQFPFKDTQCGAKAFRKEAIDAIRNDVQSTGWAFDVDLIWRLCLKGYKVVEVPISWSDASQSRLRMHQDGPAMLVELIKLRYKK